MLEDAPENRTDLLTDMYLSAQSDPQVVYYVTVISLSPAKHFDDQ